MIKVLPYSIISTILILSINCRPFSKEEKKNQLRIWQVKDAKGVNPLFVRDAFSNYLCLQVFQPLTAIDYKSEKLVGVLAKSSPKVASIDSSYKKITYQLRPNAAFDQDHPLSAKDVLFSAKLHLLKIPTSTTSSAFDFIKSVAIHPKDSSRVIFIVKKQSNVVNYCGTIQIMPQFIYDPQHTLDQFSIEMLKDKSNYNKPELIALIDRISHPKFSQNPNNILGSGAYKIKKWTKGQHIVLQRKENWYGKEYQKQNSYFDVKSKKIRYEIINDEQTAVISLKSGNLDLLTGISAKTYHSLKNEKNKSFNLKKSLKLGYNCIGFNLENKFLSKLPLRKALSHLIDKDIILEKVFYNLGEITNAPMASGREKYYNKSIASYEFDLDKAAKILDQAGFIDSDNDGWREMEIDGKAQKITLKYEYNANNKERERVGMILKNNAKKIGIDISVLPLEWNVYLERLRGDKTEIFYSAVSSSLLPPNFEGSFHSTAIQNGRNYFHYRSLEVDSIIEAMNQTNDSLKYRRLIKEFQYKVHQDLPAIFLFSNMRTFAVSNNIKGFYTSRQRPNYWAPSLHKATYE